MGKIRIKTLGLDELEEKQKKDDVRRREAKTLRQAQGKPSDQAQGKGLEGVKESVSNAVVSKEIENTDSKKALKKEKKSKKVKHDNVEELIKASADTQSLPTNTENEAVEDKKSTRKKRVRIIGKKYKQASKLLEAKKAYQIKDGVLLLKKVSYAGFDGTVELHINARETGLKGSAQLPHSIGKQVRVVIFSDEILPKIEKGEIEFDVLIARPADMPHLVPLAKILGPKGLMPNPKRGTVSENPEEAVKKIAIGGMQWKTEPKFPLIHLTIGKVSNKEDELSDNISAVLKSVGQKNIMAAFISSSMSPSIRLKV